MNHDPLYSFASDYELQVKYAARALAHKMERAIFLPILLPERFQVSTWKPVTGHVKAYIWPSYPDDIETLVNPIYGGTCLDAMDMVIDPIYTYTTDTINTKGVYARPGRFISVSSGIRDYISHSGTLTTTATSTTTYITSVGTIII
jgi:hypothetical protein